MQGELLSWAGFVGGLHTHQGIALQTGIQNDRTSQNFVPKEAKLWKVCFLEMLYICHPFLPYLIL